MKYTFVIAIAVLALFYVFDPDYSSAKVVGKETVHAFSGTTRDVHWVETDSCPPWCENGCVRQAYGFAKACK